MNANIAKVQSLIENAFTSAIEKLAKDESGNFISDLYVQADAESGELQIYDDEEHLIEKIVIFTPLFREVFWHEYAKIPRHTSQNSIAAGNLE